MMQLRAPKVEIGSNPSRFIGAYYGISYLSFERRPLITIHLVWIVVWIYPPFEHYRKGAMASRYGWHCRLKRGDPIRDFVAVFNAAHLKRKESK